RGNTGKPPANGPTFKQLPSVLELNSTQEATNASPHITRCKVRVSNEHATTGGRGTSNQRLTLHHCLNNDCWWWCWKSEHVEWHLTCWHAVCVLDAAGRQADPVLEAAGQQADLVLDVA
ncbi:hypothetical protein BC831DRAFT_475230, partial [Entophlyctis helioformis]